MKNSTELALKEIERAYTTEKIRLKSWLNVAGKYLVCYGQNSFECHLTAEDIVQELITKILEGERNWDPERVPDFDQFIFRNIQSIIEGKLRARNIVESVEVFEPKAKEGKVYKGIREGQYENNIYACELIDINDKLERCYNKLSEDDECGLVLIEWHAGKTSIEIADSLGLEVHEVENIKKRIRYKLNKKIK